jgi:hypothetical protein
MNREIIKENILMVMVATTLSSVLFLIGCQNVDTKPVEKSVIENGKQFAVTYCSDAYKPMREDLINKAREKYPQFPSFDICPLINTAHLDNVDTVK